MKVIVILKDKSAFIHYMQEWSDVLIYCDDADNVHPLNVSIQYLEKEDKTVSTVIIASEELIRINDLKKISKSLNYC
ncbi:hypothetical protein [Lelliottia sp.]|jgi:hypothetical protein|uniref:hypothetical protein n=1 Tax=Lelliottia sp. TaxID=1898429 RepID=UPI00388FA55C